MVADIMATAIMAPLTVSSKRCFQTIYFPIREKGLNVRKQASYMARSLEYVHKGTWYSDSFQRNGSTTSTVERCSLGFVPDGSLLIYTARAKNSSVRLQIEKWLSIWLLPKCSTEEAHCTRSRSVTPVI